MLVVPANKFRQDLLFGFYLEFISFYEVLFRSSSIPPGNMIHVFLYTRNIATLSSKAGKRGIGLCSDLSLRYVSSTPCRKKRKLGYKMATRGHG